MSSNASYSTGNSPSRTPLVLSDFKAGFASIAPMVHGSPYNSEILMACLIHFILYTLYNIRHTEYSILYKVYITIILHFKGIAHCTCAFKCYIKHYDGVYDNGSINLYVKLLPGQLAALVCCQDGYPGASACRSLPGQLAVPPPPSCASSLNNFVKM